MVKQELFGTDGRGNTVEKITLSNEYGFEAEIITLGAIIRSIRIPDELGEVVDVVLGYNTAKEYLENGFFFGAMIGRNGNRIDHAECTIDGLEYQLEKNDGENNLHSGANGIHQKVFLVDKISQEECMVTLTCLMESMEDGFPGNLKTAVTYRLTEGNALEIEYKAVSDRDTIINFTNHSYFNLSGHASGDAMDQEVQIFADTFTPVRKVGLIPTGERVLVEHTPMDFRVMKAIELDIEDEYDQLIYCGGYDHNYQIKGDGYRKMAEAKSGKTGIHMIAYTDCPGMQFYAGNFISEHQGKENAVYGKRSGYCFESQYFPNAVNCSEFKSPIVRANEIMRSKTAYQFFV